jgi:hypothetical protein
MSRYVSSPQQDTEERMISSIPDTVKSLILHFCHIVSLQQSNIHVYGRVVRAS